VFVSIKSDLSLALSSGALHNFLLCISEQSVIRYTSEGPAKDQTQQTGFSDSRATSEVKQAFAGIGINEMQSENDR